MNDSGDIRRILESWPYDPGDDLSVRIIEGEEGPCLQMRIDMGIIQMELDGNPTGERPEGFESWFDYYQDLSERSESNGIDDFFSLDDEDCARLRQESVRYYYRYLSLMKLGDNERVARDTDRNRRLFAFVKKYARSEMDRWSLDQYRPYVIMMNTRARASLAIREEIDKHHRHPGAEPTGIENAVEIIEQGIDDIAGFFEEYGIASEMGASVELSILKALRKEFLRNIPESLDEQLARAVEEERFEDAATLRDRIRRRKRHE
jgi:hypothetical protein